MAIEVSWSSKTTNAARNQLQDISGKETFAQSLKESGLGDPKQTNIKTVSKITGLLVIEGDLKKNATDPGALVTQKTEVQGKDMIAGLDSGGKAPHREENDEAWRVAQGEVKLSTIPDAASREPTGNEIADAPKSKSAAATKETSTAKLKKLEATKSGKGAITDATQAGEPRSMQISTSGEETARLQCQVKEIGMQSSVPCGGAPEDSSSGKRQVGSSDGQAVMNGGQRAAKEAENSKNRPTKVVEEHSVTADSKNALVKDVTDAGLQKGGGESAANKDMTAGSATSSVKVEVEVGGVMTTAIQHVSAGLISQDNAGTSHHLNMIQGANAGGGQARELEAKASLASHDAGYRDNSGLALESGPALLATTSKTLEVGMASGTHGWLKIRAEIEDGVVTASLSVRSPATQEMLHHELPSLTAFLQEEKIGVSSVMVRQTSSAGAEDMSYGSGMQQQGRAAQQNSNGKGDGTAAGSDERVWGSGDQVAMHEMWQGMSDGAAFLPTMTAGSGGWLNVRV